MAIAIALGLPALSPIPSLPLNPAAFFTQPEHRWKAAGTNSGSCQMMAATAGTLPVTLVLDNARYHHCQAVETLAAQLGIELLFLPTYSPNLNLIERLWKFTKKQCLASVYYENFAVFKQAIHGFLSTVQERHPEELKSLLTLNFQRFEKAQLLAA